MIEQQSFRQVTTYFSIDNAAKHAGISPGHMRRIAQEGGIRCFAIQGKLFILATDLTEWIKARQRPAHV